MPFERRLSAALIDAFLLAGRLLRAAGASLKSKWFFDFLAELRADVRGHGLLPTNPVEALPRCEPFLAILGHSWPIRAKPGPFCIL